MAGAMIRAVAAPAPQAMVATGESSRELHRIPDVVQGHRTSPRFDSQRQFGDAWLISWNSATSSSLLHLQNDRLSRLRHPHFRVFLSDEEWLSVPWGTVTDLSILVGRSGGL
jgi:hypothetical protein